MRRSFRAASARPVPPLVQELDERLLEVEPGGARCLLELPRRAAEALAVASTISCEA